MLEDQRYREGSVRVDGVDVCYRVAGPKNDRLPLVLVHGTAGSIDGHYGYIFPMMAYRQRVIALDWSEPTGDTLELDHLVAQVNAVIEEEVPRGPISLMGYSLGACVAAKVASQLGDKVSNLILTAGWLRTDTHQKMRNDVWRQLRNQNSETITQYMTFCAFSPAFMNLKTLDDMKAAAGMLKMSSFVDKQMELNTRIDIEHDCEAITATTLVIACTYDMMVPRHHSQQLFGAIDDARFAEIPSGHAVVYERPAELFHYVDRFTSHPNEYQAGEMIPAQKP